MEIICFLLFVTLFKLLKLLMRLPIQIFLNFKILCYLPCVPVIHSLRTHRYRNVHNLTLSTFVSPRVAVLAMSLCLDATLFELTYENLMHVISKIRRRYDTDWTPYLLSSSSISFRSVGDMKQKSKILRWSQKEFRPCLRIRKFHLMPNSPGLRRWLQEYRRSRRASSSVSSYLVSAHCAFLSFVTGRIHRLQFPQAFCQSGPGDWCLSDGYAFLSCSLILNILYLS